MRIEDCFELGFILKTHGLKGDLQLVMESDEPDFYASLTQIYLQAKSGLVPFAVTAWNPQRDKAIIHLEGIESVEKAQELKSRKVFIPVTELPVLNPDQFYFHEIHGFTVLDATTVTRVGTVTDVVEMPQQNMLVVDSNGKEVLIPLADDLLVEIRREVREIEMRLPEGLLDIYLNEPGSPDDGDGEY